MDYTKVEWEIKQTRGNNRYEYTLELDKYNKIAEIKFETAITAKAHARLIAAAPKQNNACRAFIEGWPHFLKCIDFGNSTLDAEAIRFMNEIPGKIAAALVIAES